MSTSVASKVAMRRAVAICSSKQSSRRISTTTCVRGSSRILLRAGEQQSAAAAPRSSAVQVPGRRWKSSGTLNSEGVEVTQTDSQTILANVALAAALFGFCGFVFTYSMNAVGRADASKDANGDVQADPLAQLKAEAQEAKEYRAIQKAERMTPEEVAALESGMTNHRRGNVELAVAAPAEIAELEEEANRKLFQNGSAGSEDAPKKKKPWWRFGF
mmetsp:Transcript_2067/g.6018  ORF Transcript_2067/g.6018 Transcript_2067/m.6018 type:complete len:216 (-) Transcript_2067:210-857(-)